MRMFEEKLDDQQMAVVISFIRNAWSNCASTVSRSDVSKQRGQIKQKGGGP